MRLPELARDEYRGFEVWVSGIIFLFGLLLNVYKTDHSQIVNYPNVPLHTTIRLPHEPTIGSAYVINHKYVASRLHARRTNDREVNADSIRGKARTHINDQVRGTGKSWGQFPSELQLAQSFWIWSINDKDCVGFPGSFWINFPKARNWNCRHYWCLRRQRLCLVQHIILRQHVHYHCQRPWSQQPYLLISSISSRFGLAFPSI